MNAKYFYFKMLILKEVPWCIEQVGLKDGGRPDRQFVRKKESAIKRSRSLMIVDVIPNV